MRSFSFFLWALLLVDGVFGVEKADVLVSVMEGDSVTLNPSTEIPEDDTVLWWFGDESIARINKAVGSSTSDSADGRFRDRLELDRQTGSLTISNIRTEHTGLYKLQIKSTIETFKRFSVTVHDEMNTVSVIEGGTITLYTGVTEIRGSDVILWKYEDHLIAKVNKSANRLLLHDKIAGGKFKGRLQLHWNSGDLTISDSRTTDSGVYHLEMNSSSHSLQRSISVTVSDKPTLSAAAVAGVVAGLLLAFAAGAVVGVFYHRYKISQLNTRRDVTENNRTNDPLRPETANSDAL